jgi:hypothetical protein
MFTCDKYHQLLTAPPHEQLAFNYRHYELEDDVLTTCPTYIFRTMAKGDIIEYERLGRLPKRYIFSSGLDWTKGYSNDQY